MKKCRINDIPLTRNFNLREFHSPDTGEVIVRKSVITGLQQVRDKIGKSILITSGYRTEKHNRYVGGEEQSQHRNGLAVDVSIVGHDPVELKKLLRRAGFKQVILYREKKIIHAAIYKKNPFNVSKNIA